MVIVDEMGKDLSGYPEMKEFTEYLDKQLTVLFPDNEIKIVAKGQPYMLMSMISWESWVSGLKYSHITQQTDFKVALDLVMYPAGFRCRFHEVVESKEQIVLDIKKLIDDSLNQAKKWMYEKRGFE